MKTRYPVVFLCFFGLLFSCQNKGTEFGADIPIIEDFDLAHSDPAAVQLADSIFDASGGLHEWENIQSVVWTNNQWTFNWDKKNQQARIEMPVSNSVFLFDLKAHKGKAWENGTQISNPDSLKTRLEYAYRIFAENSFSLFPSFKLKMEGAVLKYQGEDSLASGKKYNLLEITFKENSLLHAARYLAHVDINENLIRQLSYFNEQSPDSAVSVIKWNDSKDRESILLPLSGESDKAPKNVKLNEEFPEKFFSDL